MTCLPDTPRADRRHRLPGGRALAAAIAALALMLLIPLASAASEVTYRVSGVASNDVLNVRDRPGVPGSRIVGILPPGERGVVWDGQSRRAGDGGTWWRIFHPRVPDGGWVNARFLTEEASDATPVTPEVPDSPFMDHTAHERLYRVTGVAANDVLNIRSGPGASNPIVGIFPPQQRGVEITGRIRTLPSGAIWVEVIGANLRGGTGWVNGRYLTPH